MNSVVQVSTADVYRLARGDTRTGMETGMPLAPDAVLNVRITNVPERCKVPL